MGDIQVCAEELADLAGRLRAVLRGTSRPIAILASNGITPLVGRQLANECELPLVPINPLLTPPEITHILRDSN